MTRAIEDIVRDVEAADVKGLKRVYANGISEYEERFGKEHLIRWWEKQAS